MSNTITLPSIKISLLAPANAGKTTLIATVLRDIESAIPAPFKVSPSEASDQVRIADFNRELQASISSESFSFDPTGIAGTVDLGFFNYQIECNDLKQPFSMMDVPGSWLNVANRPADQWKRYEEHLKDSVALWIPFEAPLLMEANTPDTLKKSSRFLMTTDILPVVEQWANFRMFEGRKDEPAVLCFAPMKCESYFSKARPTIFSPADKKLFDKFMKEYSAVIATVKEKCPHCKIYYTPVESVGCVRLQDMDWHCENPSQFPSIKYKVLSPYYQEIRGAQALVKPIYAYGADIIKNAIQEQHDEVDAVRQKKSAAFANRIWLQRLFDYITDEDTRKMNTINDLSDKASSLREDIDRMIEALNNLGGRSEKNSYSKEL
jgi:hypothetical protein